MRFTADQVKDLISHEDGDVRELAVEYFSRPRSTDPDVMRRLMQAVERYGEQTLDYYLAPLTDLAQDEQSVAWFVEQRRKFGKPEAIEDFPQHDFSGGIERSWFHLDGRLLMPLAGEIAELLEPAYAASFNERLALWNWSAEELWSELERECKRLDEEMDDEWDMQRAGWLAQALQAHPRFAAEKVRPLLVDVESGGLGYLELFVIRLAGNLKLDVAPELLASILGCAWNEHADYLQSEVTCAMRHIGGERMITALVERVAEVEDGRFKNCASEVLSAIHSDRIVPLAFEWLRQSEPEDGWFFTKMALDQFDPAAIEPVCEWLRSTPRDPEWNGVRKHVLTMCRALQVTIPEQEAWTEDAKGDKEFNQQWYLENMPALRAMREAAESYLADVEAQSDSWAYAPPPRIETIVRDSPVVGRNDPCPCGSGKKFKKCCLHKTVSQE